MIPKVHVERLRAALAEDGVDRCVLLDYYERAVVSDRCVASGDPAVCMDAAARHANQTIYPREETEQLPAPDSR